MMEPNDFPLKKMPTALLTVKTLIRLFPQEWSDFALHCLPRPVWLKFCDHYSRLKNNKTKVLCLDGLILFVLFCLKFKIL